MFVFLYALGTMTKKKNITVAKFLIFGVFAFVPFVRKHYLPIT